MTNNRLDRFTYLSSLALCIVPLATAKSATLETEPTVTFSKAGGADWTLEENQDRITDGVWLTRKDTEGLYNAAIEDGYARFDSPLGTEWATGTTDKPLSELQFGTWYSALGGRPPDGVGLDLVMHIPADNAYYNFRFDAWGGAVSGGSFAYTRSLNPLIVPEPASAALIGIAAVALVGWRARKR